MQEKQNKNYYAIILIVAAIIIIISIFAIFSFERMQLYFLWIPFVQITVTLLFWGSIVAILIGVLMLFNKRN